MPDEAISHRMEHIEGCVCPCCGRVVPVKIKVSGNAIEEGIVTEIGWGQEWNTEPYPVITAEIILDNDGILENIDYLKEAAEYRRGAEQAMQEGKLKEYAAEHAAFIEKSRQQAEKRKYGSV